MNVKKALGITIALIVAAAGIFPGGSKAVSAAEPSVEIFFLPHRPAVAVVEKIREVLKDYPGYAVRTYSFDDPGTRKLQKRYGLTGHMPVAVFINGMNEFTVGDRTITLRNFPRGNAFVPGFEGEWSYEDLAQILQSLSAAK